MSATHPVKIEQQRMFLRSLGLLIFLDEMMRNRLSVKNMLDRISSMIIDIVAIITLCEGITFVFLGV